jgi:hypothetical protein
VIAPRQSMPEVLKKKWVSALRSGDYEQGRGFLHDGGRFCCLGVLVEVAGESADDFHDTQLPSLEFAQRHGITGTGDPGHSTLNFDLCIKGDDFDDALVRRASEWNDDGYTFAQIADAIETDIEGV